MTPDLVAEIEQAQSMGAGRSEVVYMLGGEFGSSLCLFSLTQASF